MAIAACLLILIHIKYQFAFDKHLPQLENIYRVTLNERGGNTPALLVKQMQADYPEVLNGTRISGPLESVISLQGRYIRQGGGIYVDSTFFDLFPATFLAGRSGQVLSGPRDVVLTKRVSDKLFPNGEAVGEEINVDGDDYRITAVIENPPATSSIPYEFILSMPRESWVTNGWWTGNNFYSYLLVDPNANIDQLEGKFPDFVQRYIGPEILGFYDAYATLEDYFAEESPVFLWACPDEGHSPALPATFSGYRGRLSEHTHFWRGGGIYPAYRLHQLCEYGHCAFFSQG